MKCVCARNKRVRIGSGQLIASLNKVGHMGENGLFLLMSDIVLVNVQNTGIE